MLLYCSSIISQRNFNYWYFDVIILTEYLFIQNLELNLYLETKWGAKQIKSILISRLFLATLVELFS